MATSLADEVYQAVEIFMGTLDKIAINHKRPKEYVRLLGGFGGFKKAKQRSTMPFGAWCSKKMEEENEGKEKGERTTLQEFLDRYRSSDPMHDEYELCDKEELVSDFDKAKEENDSAPTRVPNIFVSKKVYAKVGNITAGCRDLNRLFGTEIALFYGRGNNTSHVYNPGSFVTEGAKKWVENAEIGHNCPNDAARQLDTYIVSGCAKRVGRTNEGSAKSEYRKTRTNCRNTIQGGLMKILTQTDASSTDSLMNYTHYEAKIVESFGVALEGWPLPGRVSNPGNLNSNDMNTLWKALNRGRCRWVALTPEELSARKIDNQHCVANGEEVYGPPRKQRAQNMPPCGSDDNE